MSVLSILMCGLITVEGAPPPPPPPCANFSNQWIINRSDTHKIGEYAELVQMDCKVIATNPVEMWSPAFGSAEDNVIYMFGIKGTLRGKEIHWHDGIGSVWTVVEAPPLKEGLENVRTMLQHAVTVEHSVIQPYLSTLFSIVPDTNLNASAILHDVVVEEMLHMATMANLLNAVGGHPRLNSSDFTPKYPVMLPFCNISLDLAPFTKEQMNSLRRVEEATWGPDNKGKVNTIGVYYFRIGIHLRTLVHAYGEDAVFSGDPGLQVSVSSSRGTVKGIYNLSDAIEQLTGVYIQGESAQGALYDTSPYNGESELSHFYRFNEIVHDRCYSRADNTTLPSPAWDKPTGSSMGIDYSSIYKFKSNPRMSDYSNQTDAYHQLLEFNSCYTRSLADLHRAFNGAPELLGDSVQSMVKLGELAKTLMTTPDPNNEGMFLGPSFEWVDLSDSSIPSCPTAENNEMLQGDVTIV